MDTTAYKGLFLETAEEYVQKLVTNSKLLSANFTDREAISALYIAAHSIKSQSLMMGYTATGILSGTLEQIFKEAKERKIQITLSQMNLLFICIQSLKESIENIKAKDKEKDVSENYKKLEEVFHIQLIGK